MIGMVSGAGRVVVGASGSPGSLSALRYARDLAFRIDVPVGRYCLSHARCPVLAIPQPASAREMGLGSGVWPLRHRGLTADRALREWDPAHK